MLALSTSLARTLARALVLPISDQLASTDAHLHLPSSDTEVGSTHEILQEVAHPEPEADVPVLGMARIGHVVF